MSFILDALRKSENERRQSALPDISQVPLAVAGSNLPRWAVGVMVVLGISVLALAGAWWANARRAGTAIADQPLSVSEPQREARAAPPAGSGALADVAAVPEAKTPAREPQRPPAAGGQAAPPRSAARADVLPSPAALAAQGVSLRKLQLELVVYDERAASRFVFVNGSKYGEGDVLSEGPRVVMIQADGTVLMSYQGREFLLSQ